MIDICSSFIIFSSYLFFCLFFGIQTPFSFRLLHARKYRHLLPAHSYSFDCTENGGEKCARGGRAGLSQQAEALAFSTFLSLETLRQLSITSVIFYASQVKKKKKNSLYVKKKNLTVYLCILSYFGCSCMSKRAWVWKYCKTAVGYGLRNNYDKIMALFIFTCIKYKTNPVSFILTFLDNDKDIYSISMCT